MAPSQLILRAPEILRAAGCEVVEYDGWRDRGRPDSFTPIGAMLHHDGSPVGPAKPPENYAHFLFEVGRPDEGIPAPLCQFWIDFYGRWWIGAAGRANHAGDGVGWGVITANRGNTLAAGIEMDNTTDEPTTSDQYEALHRGLPTLYVAYDWDPSDALTAHKEYARGRKSDPDDIEMPRMRSDVAYLMENPLGDDMSDVANQQIAELYDHILGKKSDGKPWGVGPGQTTVGGTIAAGLDTSQGIVNQVNEVLKALGVGEGGTPASSSPLVMLGADDRPERYIVLGDRIEHIVEDRYRAELEGSGVARMWIIPPTSLDWLISLGGVK